MDSSQSNDKKSNTGLFVGIGLFLLVIIGVIVFVLTYKAPESNPLVDVGTGTGSGGSTQPTGAGSSGSTQPTGAGSGGASTPVPTPVTPSNGLYRSNCVGMDNSTKVTYVYDTLAAMSAQCGNNGPLTLYDGNKALLKRGDRLRLTTVNGQERFVRDVSGPFFYITVDASAVTESNGLYRSNCKGIDNGPAVVSQTSEAKVTTTAPSTRPTTVTYVYSTFAAMNAQCGDNGPLILYDGNKALLKRGDRLSIKIVDGKERFFYDYLAGPYFYIV